MSRLLQMIGAIDRPSRTVAEDKIQFEYSQEINHKVARIQASYRMYIVSTSFQSIARNIDKK